MSPDIITAVRAARQQSAWPLYLFGPPGVGKTFAAALLYASWPQSALWYSFTEFCDLLRAFNVAPMQTVGSGSHTYEVSLAGLWRKVESASLLVIDEIGTRESTPHRYDALLRLLDVRAGKPTVITSNLIPEKVGEAYDDRVLSRLSAGMSVKIQGKDRRSIGLENRVRVARSANGQH